MAKKFKKTYISVHEFVNSWEKEIYELSNLDYFTYLLINNVAGEIENGFMPSFKDSALFKLESDEIGTLAFNLGDNLQQFFEENCFGSCPLNCPLHLSDVLTERDEHERRIVLAETPLLKSACKTKESCLYTDVMNYVVVETLIEFFHFEKAMMIDEKEYGVVQFSDFIVGLVIQTINQYGQSLLLQNQESASRLFEKLLNHDEYDWQGDTMLPGVNDDEFQEGDEWKIDQYGVHAAIQAFRGTWRCNPLQILLLDRFEEFLIDFLNIRKVQDISINEVREFFTMVVAHEVLANMEGSFDQEEDMFYKLFEFLDYNYGTSLIANIALFTSRELPELKRTINVMETYNRSHPLLDYLLLENGGRNAVMDGFFCLQDIQANSITVRDVHLQSVFSNVEVLKINTGELRKGDILHMQISAEQGRHRMAHLEMIYPGYAKSFLF